MKMSFGGASGSDFLEGRLPVFVFPTNLVFYSDDPQSHTRVVTIYNPYDFPLNYKMMSTDPNKYSVTEPEVCILVYDLYALFDAQSCQQLLSTVTGP